MIFHLIHLKNVSIFEQLLLEEELLRNDSRNFCLIYEGALPAIVMGISGKAHELVHAEKTIAYQYPVIKRFSGGGTVFVDENTLFVAFICNKAHFDFPAYPEKILKWSEQFYSDAFALPGFHLRENDFVIGEKKCGGNAQYIKKDRWLQHTSFLWDFCQERMQCLLHPRKAPNYREGRSHNEFLCKLKDHYPSKEAWISRIKNTLSERYQIVTMPYLSSNRKGHTSNRTATSLISLSLDMDPS
jgi:lipoate---protein ligase